MVKMEGFDRYHYDPDNREVYSRMKGDYTRLKVQKDESKDYWNLYKHGHKRKVYHWEILRDNKEGIDSFIEKRMQAKTFSGSHQDSA